MNMKKQIIKLTEDNLHRIIENSVRRCLNEIGDTPQGQYMLGRLHAAHKYLGKNDTDDIRNYAIDRYKKNKENFPNRENIFSNENYTDLPFSIDDDNDESSMDFFHGDLGFYDDISQDSDTYTRDDYNDYYQEDY